MKGVFERSWASTLTRYKLDSRTDVMDAPEIAMEERVKVDDRVASTMLHASAASDTSITSATELGGTTQEVSSAPEVSHPHSLNNQLSCPYCICEHIAWLGWIQLNIFTAARLGKSECIRTLIESGRARTTDHDEDDITALHWAAISGKAETCEYLIDHGADVNAVTRTLLATPLQWSALQGLPDVVHLLIQRGADPRLLDAQGYSFLHAATHSSSYWCLLLVLCQPGVSPDERDRKGRTALHWDARQRDEVLMRVLLRCGAEPNAVDRDGRTPLHWAAVGGNGGASASSSRRARSSGLGTGSDARRGTWRTNSGTAMRGTRRLRKWSSRTTGRSSADRSARYAPGVLWVPSVACLWPVLTVAMRLQPHVKIVVFSVPSLSLCIAFAITSVFPWYMSIVLALAALFAMHLVRTPYFPQFRWTPLTLGCQVVLLEFLQRRSVSDSIYSSPYFLGVIFGSGLWIAYAWATRLRSGAPQTPLCSLIFIYSRAGLGAHYSPYVHGLFVLLFCLCVFAPVLTIPCDPGTIVTPTRDELKLVGGIIALEQRFRRRDKSYRSSKTSFDATIIYVFDVPAITGIFRLSHHDSAS